MMLSFYLLLDSRKGALPAQPLIDDNAQGILVTGRTWFALKLLRGHVGRGSGLVLRALGRCTLGDNRQAEIAEQNSIVPPDQHILRLDITVDHLLRVRIL